MSKASTKTEQNRLQSIFVKLSPFDISEFLRDSLTQKNKADSITDSDLREIIDAVKDESKVWTENSIKRAIRTFYKYPSLQNLSKEKLALLDPEGEFAKYIVSISDSNSLAFKSAIFDAFTLLSRATTLNPNEQEIFFDSYPPRGQDLQCIGGTGSRSYDTMVAINSDQYGRYFVDAYKTSSSKMTERIRRVSPWGNAVHIPRYLEYILSLVSQEELDEIDDNTFSLSSYIPTSYLVKSLDDFATIYKQSLVDSVSDERLREESRIEIIEAIKAAIVKANKKTDDKDSRGNILTEYTKYDEIGTDLFDDLITENDFDNYDNENGEDPPNPRVSLAVRYLVEGLSAQRDPGYYFNMDVTGQLEPDQERRLNVDRLIEELYQDKLTKIEERFKELFFDAKEVISDETPPPPKPELPLSIRICSQGITEEITRKLKSSNVEDVSSAIEILYLLSIKTSSSPAIHFVEVMNNSHIREFLESIVRENKLNIPQNYIEKITNRGDDSKRVGILDRYEEYLAEYKAYRELLSSDEVAPRDRVAQIVTGSTEESLQTIRGLNASDKLSEAVSPADDPDYRYPGVGNIKDEDHPRGIIFSIVRRGDRYEIVKEVIKSPDLSQEFLHELVQALILCGFEDDSIISGLIDRIDDINKINSLGRHSLNLAILFGKTNIAKKILSRDDVSVNLVDDARIIPLYNAIAKGDVEVFDELVLKGADICKKGDDNSTFLHHAVTRGSLEILRKLLNHNKIDINETGSGGLTALHYAVKKGDPDIVRELLLVEGVDVNVKDEHGKTPFHHAAYHGNQEIFRQLIDKGAHTNQPDSQGQTPLQLSIIGNNFEIFHELFSKNDIYVSRADNGGATPLLSATIGGNINIVRELLTRQEVAIDRFENSNIINPLNIAVHNGNLEIVENLLLKGANPNLQNKSGDTALHKAAREGHLKVVQKLIASGAQINKTDNCGCTPLSDAVFYGHFNVVEELLSQDGIEVHDLDSSGGNLLHVAALSGHLEIFKKLLSIGLDIHQKDNSGQTLLHIAAVYGEVEIIREALSIPGLDIERYINQPDERGATPLIVAAREGNLEVVRELISRGAKIDIQNDDGSSALFVASMSGFLGVIKELLLNHANVNQPIKEEKGKLYPLDMAIYNGHLDIARELIINGADINLKNNDDQNILHTAAVTGKTEIIKEILSVPGLDIGQYINQKDKNGDTPLILAAADGHLGVVKELISRGADINLKNKAGDSAISIAIKNGHSNIAQELLSIDQLRLNDSYSFDHRETSLLSIAIIKGNFEIARNIINKNGVDINLPNEHGYSSLFVAAGANFDLFKEMVSKGADVNSRGHDEIFIIMMTPKEDNRYARKLMERGVKIPPTKVLCDGYGNLKLKDEFPYIDSIVKNIKQLDRVLNGLRPDRSLFNRSPRPTLDEFLDGLEEDKGAVLNCQDKDGKNALYFSVKAKPRWDIGKIVALVSHGANHNIKGYKDKTFAEYAFEKNKPEVLQFLLTQSEVITSEMIKKTIDTKTAEGTSFLQDVLDKGSEEMIDIFIEADVKYNEGRSLESIKDGVRSGEIQSQKVQAFIARRFPPANSARGPRAGALILEDRELSSQSVA